MSFQAYLDNIKAKTGKTPADFAKLAAKKGRTTHGEIVAWLKSDFALGHGHATAIAAVLLKSGAPKAGSVQKMDALFSGKKSHWGKACDALIAQITQFGPDVVVEANRTYVNLLRSLPGRAHGPRPSRWQLGFDLHLTTQSSLSGAQPRQHL
jgi:hypothetical protein